MQCETELNKTVEHTILKYLRYAEERAEVMVFMNGEIGPNEWTKYVEGKYHGKYFFCDKGMRRKGEECGLAVQTAILAEIPLGT